MMDTLEDDASTETTASLVESDVISLNRKIKSNLTATNIPNICFKLEDSSHHNHHHHHSHNHNHNHNHNHHNTIDSNNNSNNGKVCVQYVISYHSDGASFSPRKFDIHSIASKLDSCENEKRGFISLPVGNLNELECSSSPPVSKSHASISSTNSSQRSLISPTDFLTLSEETSSAVKRDVNLSASRLESIIKKNNDSSLNVSLDRYCESPFLMETPREVPLMSDDDASNNGRASRLSESHEEMPGDDLFSTTLADQHNSIREVVITPIESENSRATPLIRESSRIYSGPELKVIKEDKFEPEEVIEEHGIEENGIDDMRVVERCNQDNGEDDVKPNFASLNPLPHKNSIPITSSSSSTGSRTSHLTRSSLGEPIVLPSLISSRADTPPMSSASSIISSVNASTASNSNPVNSISNTTSINGSSSQQSSATNSATRQAGPLDIKILPTGLLQLAANLASVFPSSTIHKQIALQLLREDGTSIIVPIATRGQDSNSLTISAVNEQRDQTNSTASNSLTTIDTNNKIAINNNTSSPKSGAVESGSGSDTERPFKCELCNSTFTRLGNYTRHKKIHSLPSKEDQRFRCDICGKSFIQRCDLARHLHIHRGTEPHRCSQCGKGYIRHSDLVTHQRFHNKEKPFACPHCSKGFCQRGDLNRHLRSIHLQLKPILCSHCHKKFAKEETLLRHINANHRDVVN